MILLRLKRILSVRSVCAFSGDEAVEEGADAPPGVFYGSSVGLAQQGFILANARSIGRN
jgi:hypothetical protein